MSYDTEHVRNAGSTPGGIAGVPTFAQLVDNPDLAALYTELRRASSTTAPALVETMRVSKKTVYDYLHRLEQAGLVVRRKEGRWHYYRLSGRDAPPAARRALRWVRDSLKDEPRVARDAAALCCVREKDLSELAACYG